MIKVKSNFTQPYNVQTFLKTGQAGAGPNARPKLVGPPLAVITSARNKKLPPAEEPRA